MFSFCFKIQRTVVRGNWSSLSVLFGGRQEFSLKPRSIPRTCSPFISCLLTSDDLPPFHFLEICDTTFFEFAKGALTAQVFVYHLLVAATPSAWIYLLGHAVLQLSEILFTGIIFQTVLRKVLQVQNPLQLVSWNSPISFQNKKCLLERNKAINQF